ACLGLLSLAGASGAAATGEGKPTPSGTQATEESQRGTISRFAAKVFQRKSGFLAALGKTMSRNLYREWSKTETQQGKSENESRACGTSEASSLSPAHAAVRRLQGFEANLQRTGLSLE